MDENKSITYDDLIQTRNTQILKSIKPYLSFRHKSRLPC